MFTLLIINNSFKLNVTTPACLTGYFHQFSLLKSKPFSRETQGTKDKVLSFVRAWYFFPLVQVQIDFNCLFYRVNSPVWLSLSVSCLKFVCLRGCHYLASASELPRLPATRSLGHWQPCTDPGALFSIESQNGKS